MSESDDKSFAQQPRTIAAALVVVVILACLAVVLFGGLGGDDAAEPAPQEPASSQAKATPANDEAAPPRDKPEAPRPVDSNYNSACGLSGGSTTTPTSAPPEVEWEEVDGWYFPVSKSAGPAERVDDGPWSCFAQTPTGALLAAYTIPIRLDGIAEDWPKVLADQTVPGVAQTAREGQGRAATSVSTIATPKGFVVESYTNELATISLYLSTPELEVTCSVRLEWAGGPKGDWLLRLEPDGSSYAGCIEGAPGRYVPWGPAQ